MSFDLAVVIGRFQPFHTGHLAVIRSALAQAPRVLIVLGSARRARTVRDPWSPNERREMIRAALGPDAERLLFAPVEDRLYNDQQWVSDVQAAVEDTLAGIEVAPTAARLALVGYAKDSSSFYLRLFPQWRLVEVGFTEGLSATDLRDLYFGEAGSGGAGIQLRASLPAPVLDYLELFRKGPHYKGLEREWQFLRAYRQQFESLAYPPTFVTADAVVVQSGHLLLVQRGAEPGKGLWALPGGFVDVSERVEAAVLRELKEETRIKCPEPVLRGAIRETRVFDHPERSLRGRTITHASLIELPPHGEGLYAVRGGSDADKARWIPISTVLDMGETMFETI